MITSIPEAAAMSTRSPLYMAHHVHRYERQELIRWLLVREAVHRLVQYAGYRLPPDHLR